MSDEIHGNLKLFGFEGYVQGEVWTIHEGSSVVIGKSLSCDISLCSLINYTNIDPKGIKSNVLLKSISDEHLRITYNSPTDLVLENISNSYCFLNHTKMPEKTVINDIFKQNYILTLGLTETFQLIWIQLLDRKKMKIIELPEDAVPPEGAIEFAE